LNPEPRTDQFRSKDKNDKVEFGPFELFLCILWQKIVLGYFRYLQMAENYTMIEIKLTERSDILKYSIVNIQ
jgi:hypothetical protein